MASGDWWYNSDSGAINQQTIPDWAGGSLEAHLGLGWHGPFKTKQLAIDYYNNNKKNNPGWKPPTDNIAQQFVNVAPGGTDIQHAVSGGLGWLQGNIETIFIRVGEVLIGLVLLGIGVAMLTGTGNVISKTAKVAL